ncbi:uncharacterized protein SPPG_08541 [Spizellomyces punctatus DAOM BR117]|uniref:Uncharacterized protein n=1 Tax=Spizellomyces punctatus (strain DAOM BR117) TaxID=645134 RepID=A0A0L0H619_SPIPD|nr:uncharacterized protein SPPG_08541 [Spizellomyces punctatus DAOM BR117]KNC96153.1 hypothetical protein SPPG_08541 [Spizellomyces punctatus DAOM BR117]|eukprot:XP_016604193.1 hypothetical protein SPPG_08541 [Spizellomyces punctatus DAOM BR117]
MASRHPISNVSVGGDAGELQSPKAHSSGEESTGKSSSTRQGNSSAPAAPMGQSSSFSTVTSPAQTTTSADSTSHFRKRPRIEGNLGCVFADCEPDMWEYRFQRPRPPKSELIRTWDGHPEFRKQFEDLVDLGIQRYLRLEALEPNHLARFALWAWGLNVAYAMEGQDMPEGEFFEAQTAAIDLGKSFRDETRLCQRIIFKYDFDFDFVSGEQALIRYQKLGPERMTLTPILSKYMAKKAKQDEKARKKVKRNDDKGECKGQL